MKTPETAGAIGYSYLRFSSATQADGDSVRRQTALRDAWLKRNPTVRLDTSLTLVDAGVSGFTGTHRKNKKHALAVFLDLVERGRVPVGSYFIVENLDRLTRETPVDSIPAVLGLIKAGITVVQLAPTEVQYNAEMDQGRLMLMLWELSRGNSESKRKAQLCGDAWKQKKDLARTSKTPYGRMCPAWLEPINDQGLPAVNGDAVAQYRVRADAARAVRRVYEICVEGAGMLGIVAKLNAEGVPPFGATGVWERSYILKILHTQAVLGIYQPHSGSRVRKPDGEPVRDFYPAIITEDLWHQAQRAIKNRTKRTGRPTKAVHNPLSGLLRSAVDGSTMYVFHSSGRKYLVSGDTIRKGEGKGEGKGGLWRSFALEPFTTAVLARLAELKAADLFADPGAESLVELTNRLTEVERRLSNAVAQFEADPESQQWQLLVTKYDREKRAVVKELAEERQKAANPLSVTWTEAVELMARNEPDRLRAAMLSVAEDVLCVFVTSGAWKLAAVQVNFRGGGARHYVIAHRGRRGPKATGKPAQTHVRTFAEAGAEGIDLRKPDDVAAVDRLLLAIDTSKL